MPWRMQLWASGSTRNAHVGVAVLLDEARGDEVPGGVYGLCGFPVAEPSHRDDPVADDRDVGSEPGAAGAVEHAAVLDEQVVHVCLRLRRFALGYRKMMGSAPQTSGCPPSRA